MKTIQLLKRIKSTFGLAAALAAMLHSSALALQSS